MNFSKDCLEHYTEPALFCVDHKAEQKAQIALPPETSNTSIHMLGKQNFAWYILHRDNSRVRKVTVPLPQEFGISAFPVFLFRGRLTGFKQNFHPSDAVHTVHLHSCSFLIVPATLGSFEAVCALTAALGL